MAIEVSNIPGLGSRFFPEGTSDDAIKSAIEKERNYGAQEPGAIASAMIGLGHGTSLAGAGLEQIGVGLGEKIGTQPKGAYDAYSQSLVNQEQQYKRGLGDPTQEGPARNISGNIGSLVGQALPYIGLTAAPEAIIGKLGLSGLPAIAARMGGNYGAGAAEGLAGPIKPGQSRIASGIVGGGVNAVGGELFNLGGKIISKGVNAYRGEMIPGTNTDIIDEGIKRKIPVFANNATNDPALNYTARYLETVPSGMVGQLKDQGEKATAAIKKQTAAYKNQMLSTNYGGARGLSPIIEAANQPFKAPRQQAAQQLLEDIGDAGSEWQKIAQSSGDVRSFRVKLAADKLYNRVDKVTEGIPLEAPTTLSAVNDVRANVLENLDQTNPITNSIRTSLSSVIDKIDPAAPTATYKQLKTLSTEIGHQIDGFYSGQNAIIGKNGVAHLQAVKNAVDIDLKNFGDAQGGQIKNAIDKAQSFWKNYAVPYKNRKLAGALRNDDADTVYGSFIKNGQNKGAAQILYNALDAKGQAAVRYGTLKDAMESAKDQVSGDISIPKMLNAIYSKRGANKVFFNGAHSAELKGYTNLLSAVKRSSNASFIADTGRLNVPFGLAAGAGATGAGLIGGPIGAVAGILGVLGSAAGARLLLTTNAGRKYLLTASQLHPNSKGMDRLLVSIGDLIKTGTSQQTADSASQ